MKRVQVTMTADGCHFCLHDDKTDQVHVTGAYESSVGQLLLELFKPEENKQHVTNQDIAGDDTIIPF